MDSTESLMLAKYHLSIAERMFNNYFGFREKRFIIGAINELARATKNLIKAYLILEKKPRKNQNKNIISFQKISNKHITQELTSDLLKILEIHEAQKKSPVEFEKKNKIILLVLGKYKILTIERLSSLINSTKEAIKLFPKNFRQV